MEHKIELKMLLLF